MQGDGSRPSGGRNVEQRATGLVAAAVDWICRCAAPRAATVTGRVLARTRCCVCAAHCSVDMGEGLACGTGRARGALRGAPQALVLPYRAHTRRSYAQAASARRQKLRVFRGRLARAPAAVADAARLPRRARSVPASIFEGDSEADRAGVYRRSHAAKFYDAAEDRLVQRPAAPEYVPAPPSAAGAHGPDFTVKVVNGVAQVVARGPADAAELEAAALRSESLLVAPLKEKAKGKGKMPGDDGPGGGEIQAAPSSSAGGQAVLLQSATSEQGRRKGGKGDKFSLE